MSKIKGMIKTRFYDGWWIQRKWHRLQYGLLGDPYFEFWKGQHAREITFSAHHYEVVWSFKRKQLCEKGCCYR